MAECRSDKKQIYPVTRKPLAVADFVPQMQRWATFGPEMLFQHPFVFCSFLIGKYHDPSSLSSVREKALSFFKKTIVGACAPEEQNAPLLVTLNQDLDPAVFRRQFQLHRPPAHSVVNSFMALLRN